VLLNHNAYVNAKNEDGFNALMFAIQYGHLATAQFLKLHGAKVTRVVAIKEEAIFMQSVELGQYQKAKEMIDNDININVQYFNTGDTALIKAVKNSDQLLVELLLDNGADTGIKNWAGLTAKELAVDKSILKLLK
jgi:ankyrin repeat protein